MVQSPSSQAVVTEHWLEAQMTNMNWSRKRNDIP